MKNKPFKVVIAAALIGVGIWMGSEWSAESSIHADTALSPGSADDPVVTKSYVDQKLAGVSVTNPADTGTTSGDSSKVEIVTVKNGQTLLAKDGAEIVVRAGIAIAYSSDDNGIADVTSGSDIKNGMAVNNNHLLLFPRGGRGITTSPSFSGSLIVMVSGGYEINEPQT